MSKQILVTSVCDYPECEEVDREIPEGETGQVRPVEVLFYVRSRGRKTKIVTVDMCQAHIDEMKTLYQALAKVDQGKVNE